LYNAPGRAVSPVTTGAALFLPYSHECVLHMATEWARVDEGGAEALDDWLAVHPDAGLVVVDILKVVRPSVSGNRGIYDADYEVLQSMQRLAGTHGLPVLVVHHTRKMAASDPVDEVSGYTGLSGGADGIMVLKRDRGKADAYLHVTGREIENEAELALKWNTALASWTLAGDANEYRLSEERRSLLEALRAGGGMSPKEIAEALGKSVGSVKVLLGEMVKVGQVSNPAYGKYVLPDDAPYSAYPAYSSNGDGGKSKGVSGVRAIRGTLRSSACTARRGRRLPLMRPGTPSPQGRRPRVKAGGGGA
jgi:DNA-binding NarL/FixJ family response regulator